MSASNQDRLLALLDAYAAENTQPIAFELAYQVRVAIDRMKFAIKQIEQSAHSSDELREADMQLLDALDRLESVERNFQSRYRRGRDAALIAGSSNGSARLRRSQWQK